MNDVVERLEEWKTVVATGPVEAGWYECQIAPGFDARSIVVLWWDGEWQYRGRRSGWNGDVKAYRRLARLGLAAERGDAERDEG